MSLNARSTAGYVSAHCLRPRVNRCPQVTPAGYDAMDYTPLLRFLQEALSLSPAPDGHADSAGKGQSPSAPCVNPDLDLDTAECDESLGSGLHAMARGTVRRCAPSSRSAHPREFPSVVQPGAAGRVPEPDRASVNSMGSVPSPECPVTGPPPHPFDQASPGRPLSARSLSERHQSPRRHP